MGGCPSQSCNFPVSFRDSKTVKTFSFLALGAPLSSAETARADPALVGDWLEKSDQEIYRVTAKNGAWMHVDILKAGVKTDSYDFFPTTIGKNSFANVVLTKKDDQILTDKAYTFIRYSLSSKGVLKMWSMSPEAAKAAVKAGKLQGFVTKDKDPDVSLTDDSASLVKFIENADLDKLFTNQAMLVRINSAAK
jgi:hypothetical protein